MKCVIQKSLGVGGAHHSAKVFAEWKSTFLLWLTKPSEKLMAGNRQPIQLFLGEMGLDKGSGVHTSFTSLKQQEGCALAKLQQNAFTINRQGNSETPRLGI